MEMHWKTYEEVAAFLINKFASKFGLEKVEGKQKVSGISGTSYEIDAKGISKNGRGVIIIECRKKKKRLDQEQLCGFAFRIIDTNSKAGIIVTPLDLQKGAKLIAKARKITHVILSADSTTTEYMMKFLKETMIGVSLHDTLTATDQVTVTLKRKCKKCGKEFIVRERILNTHTLLVVSKSSLRHPSLDS